MGSVEMSNPPNSRTKDFFNFPALSLTLAGIFRHGAAAENTVAEGGDEFSGGGKTDETVEMSSENSGAARSEEEINGDGGDHEDDGDGDGDGKNNNKKKRKKYHRHTADQIREMEALFKDSPHPDEKQRQQLSKQLGLAPRQIKFWFQNRRTQIKAGIFRHGAAVAEGGDEFRGGGGKRDETVEMSSENFGAARPEEEFDGDGKNNNKKKRKKYHRHIADQIREMEAFWSFYLSFVFIGCSVVAEGYSSNKLWLTLDGNAPLVIANGGFSGLFPDSSEYAYRFAGVVSPDVIFWCDVQLLKDESGICFPRLTLDNGSDISVVYKNRKNTYSLNGESIQGYFPLDFTLDEMANISLRQDILNRYDMLDGTSLHILPVDYVAQQLAPRGLWLNIQHDEFYTKQKLSMRRFALSMFNSSNFISSPEVNFLKSLLSRKPASTKLVFRFMGKNEVEPSTNQSYGSLLGNLTFIKTFASGILVPKSYIWPVDDKLYLLPHSSVVSDAHQAGLEIFASDFANDAAFAYDFSYDPLAEYLHFIDNGNFSVDGVVSDFPATPSEAIGCFSHVGKVSPGEGKFLVISSQGSSGDFPGCTDLAYQKAISDGVDVLDCPVQMSKDGIPICLGSINLMGITKIAESVFSNLTMSVPELGTGIYTFSLTWSQIQSLTAAISNPYANKYGLYRNPKFGNNGKFMTLSEFLVLANNTTLVSGALISIENAVYLAENQGLGVTDAVLDALRKTSGTKTIMIQSSNSSVLNMFKESNYELVYKVDEDIRDVDTPTITDIKRFANSVVISKVSVFPVDQAFLTGMTNIVSKLQSFNLSVYVHGFRNEFVSQPWDFYSDPNVEVNNYIEGAGINGVITEFPATAVRYKRNLCSGMGDNIPPFMKPVKPGELMALIASAEAPQMQPPAEPPNGQHPKALFWVFLSYFCIVFATLALLCTKHMANVSYIS